MDCTVGENLGWNLELDHISSNLNYLLLLHRATVVTSLDHVTLTGNIHQTMKEDKLCSNHIALHIRNISNILHKDIVMVIVQNLEINKHIFHFSRCSILQIHLRRIRRQHHHPTRHKEEILAAVPSAVLEFCL